MEESFVGEPHANGLVEGAVGEVNGVIGSLLWAMEQLHGVKLVSTIPAASRLDDVANKSWLDGRTAFELRKGKLYRKMLGIRNHVENRWLVCRTDLTRSDRET